MKKLFYALLAVAFFSVMPLQAVEEVVELDTSDEKTTDKLILYGDVKEKEIYSYSNYAESVESAGASVDIITRKEIERQNHQRNFWKPRFASN